MIEEFVLEKFGVGKTIAIKIVINVDPSGIVISGNPLKQQTEYEFSSRGLNNGMRHTKFSLR